jgi:hypothetical protein
MNDSDEVNDKLNAERNAAELLPTEKINKNIYNILNDNIHSDLYKKHINEQGHDEAIKLLNSKGYQIQKHNEQMNDFLIQVMFY